MKEQLLLTIKKWMTEHPNPYNHAIEESVYWTMHDLLIILSNTEDEQVVSRCQTIFNRFKFYYL